MSAVVAQRNQEATCYVGNLDEQVTDELLWELCNQAGPVIALFMPKDKVIGCHQGYGFVEYQTEEDANYAQKVLNMIRIYGKPIRVNKATADKKKSDVGANLYISNLASEVDEKQLYDTFSAFGGMIMDPDTGESKGHGFCNFDSFEASDLAIESMNGQFLCNQALIVQYAFNKSNGERHGTEAERKIFSTQIARKKHTLLRPHTRFGTGGPSSGLPKPKPSGRMLGVGIQRSGMKPPTMGLGNYQTKSHLLPPLPPSNFLPPRPPPPPSMMPPPPPSHMQQNNMPMPPPPPSHMQQNNMPMPPPPPPHMQQNNIPTPPPPM